LIGTGGNSGSQVTTTITRALALGEITFTDTLTVLRKEFLTALVVGSMLGLLGYIYARFLRADPILALVVGLALPSIVIWATIVGSLLPIAAKRIGIDPALMSAPFISTLVDATGLIIYLELVFRIA
jgi:magnesium transporter